MMKRKFFVKVEVREGARTYDEYFLSEAEEGKEKESFLNVIKEFYGYGDEDFDTEGNYFDGSDVIHLLADWSEINAQEWDILKRWFFVW